MSQLLSLDYGTSSVKVGLFDTDRHELVAVTSAEYPIYQPQPNIAEQDPNDWWQATTQAVRRCVSQIDSRHILAIGLTGQMHGFVPLDASHLPLSRAIIWADQRSADVIPKMLSLIDEATYLSIAGTTPVAGFMASSLFWLRDNQPALLDSMHQVLFPKDWIRFQLTGDLATDPSDASASGFFNIRKESWSDELIPELGLPSHIFPTVQASASQAGILRQDVADEWGIAQHIPVITGCADQPAQALTNGLINMGKASITIGTGGQVFVPFEIGDDFAGDARVHVFNHAVPNRHYVLGAILSAGLALRWCRNLFGLGNNPDAYQILSQEASQVPIGAEGLLFLPHLVGERTPHMDASARGAFVGLGYHHTRGHMARAIMEGVAFALRQTLEVCLSLTPPIESLICSGGALESDVWRGILVDVLGMSLIPSAIQEQTTVGSALLAGIGMGLYDTFESAVNSLPAKRTVVTPNMDNHHRYNTLYEQYRGLYPTLKTDFHRLHHFSLEFASTN